MPPLWWTLQLVGLPDIGEPFDVEAFCSFRIPDDRNACVLYREAAGRLRPLVASSKTHEQEINLHAPWSQTDPAARRWVEDNREAMDLFRRGTERPDALEPELASAAEPSWNPIPSFRSFQSLALLEASRLEQRGDMAGAWVWYCAAMRSAYHLGLRGSIIMRLVAQQRYAELRRRLAPWVEDSRTTPDLIRRAIDDTVACGTFSPSESYSLKAEYHYLEDELTRPSNPGRQLLIGRLAAVLRSHSYQLDPDQVGALADAWRWWRREPERSRRVLRLAIANRLACDDLPSDRRPARDPDVSGPFDLYAPGLEAPARARALSPAALDRWLQTSTDAQELLRSWDSIVRPLRVRERANHRALVTMLADELYRRDHGAYPPTDEALVGPYLKKLPDDGSGDAGPQDAPGTREASGAGDSSKRE